MAYAMPRPSAPDVGTFLDNADPGRTLSQHLQHAVPAAQRLCICTGYVSGQGLEFLAECLDQLDPQAEVQLLIGMPPTGWKYPPSTATAGRAGPSTRTAPARGARGRWRPCAYSPSPFANRKP